MTEFTVTLSATPSYAALVGPRWLDLPAAVRRRFDAPPGQATSYRTDLDIRRTGQRPLRALDSGQDIAWTSSCRLYCGEVIETSITPTGRILANLARLVGGPMPVTPGALGPTVVAVTPVASYGPDRIDAQVWTRSYARPGRFPQVIQSAKCFAGPTGLEERLGYGLVMRLRTTVEGAPGSADLVFRSAGYRLRIGRLDVPLPALLTPGACEVRHHDEGRGTFTFTLTLVHPLFGRLLKQVARYHDQPQPEARFEGGLP